MDWKFFAQLLTTFFVASLGWWTAHFLSARRDLANERRKLRITYLLEAYRLLESASHRDDQVPLSWSRIESAIADVQLLGSPHQVSLARSFAKDIARDGVASIDELILDLRNSLRVELELEPVFESIIYFRYYPSLSP